MPVIQNMVITMIQSLIKIIRFCESKEKCSKDCCFFKQELNRKVCTIGIPKNWKIPKDLLKNIIDLKEVKNEETSSIS